VERLLDADRRRRLTLTDIEGAVAAAAPDVGAGEQRRTLVAAVLGALADAGRVTLPRTLAAWEQGHPDLPRWITRADSRAPAGLRRRRFPWRPELAWAATLQLSDAQFAVLKAIQVWLRDRRGDDLPCGVRERSVDVFRDDKRLESLLGGPLFAPGRLSLALLDCEAAYPPLVARPLPGGGDWLVVENATTFRTIAAWPEVIPEVSLLIYGAGGQAQAGLPALLADRPRPQNVWWFGDIDRDGLSIASRAATAMRVEGLDVVAHLGLYRALVRRGVAADSRVAAMDLGAAKALAAWLADGELVRFAVDVLTAGRRAMQEQVGPRELRALSRQPHSEPSRNLSAAD
jgi:hypothetical protein